MSMNRRMQFVLGVAAVLAAAPALAQKCGKDHDWRNVHEGAASTIVTSDVKGSRNTDIFVCRTADESGKDLVVSTRFEGGKEWEPLDVGDCANRYSKWAVIRSEGKAGAGGAAVATGTYKLCRD